MESHQRQEERDNLNPDQSEENHDFDLRRGSKSFRNSLCQVDNLKMRISIAYWYYRLRYKGITYTLEQYSLGEYKTDFDGT